MQPDEQAFLSALYQKTEGDTAKQLSMYEIGEAMGLDKTQSSRLAETLMAENMVEIRSLSGAIALSQTGKEEIEGLAGDAGSVPAIRLGEEPVVEEGARQGVEAVVAEIKNHIMDMALDFEALTELVADLRSIDAQLFSPKPKTAIIRELFKSIESVIENAQAKESLGQVRALLGR
jgi:hypothetical protein